MREAATLALLGSGSGLILTLWLGRYAESSLFGVTPLDALSLVGAVGLVVVSAVVVALIPAVSALRVNASVELRR